MNAAKQTQHKIVSELEWLAARKELLAAEKEFDRQRDALSARRRELPWLRVQKGYLFDGPDGKQSLSDLFRCKSQLIVYHFMLGPGWKEGCHGCSYVADHFDGMQLHLDARDAAFTVISRATLPEITAFKKRMGWNFPWVSSNASDFNFDYNVSFTAEDRTDGKVYYNYGMREFPADEAQGLSVFYKNSAGEIFHTYSTYARGLDILIGAYNYMDLLPKGRDEEGLSFSMAWLRHHDRYENYQVDPNATYVPPQPIAQSVKTKAQ